MISINDKEWMPRDGRGQIAERWKKVVENDKKYFD